ncbi:hypothetical protein QSJ16_02810 [Limosilactobacillus reuteri]|uniref:hypothetical protein n=1 Tax=Limosilactobacillus reuteri TaxID=1598 RepID=UPI00259BCED7|nr:hypothetical protein [Limosilactobacillus reuteri]WJK31483.1 hypothetical protein QSJ16_02810 [Limosilactobacillus reuteri]
MGKNLRKNYFWFLLAMETYGLGILFILKHSAGTFTPPGHVLEFLDDPPFIFLLAMAGTLAMVYALWDVKRMFYKPIMTGFLTFVWLMFLSAFLYQDFMMGHFGFQSLFASFIVLLILGEILIKRG